MLTEIYARGNILIFDFRSDAGLEYILFLTGLPEVVKPGSGFLIQGLVQFILNPQNLPFTALQIQVNYTLGVAPQSFIVSPNAQGEISFFVQTASDVLFPQKGTITLNDVSTGALLTTQEVNVFKYNPVFSASPDRLNPGEVSLFDIRTAPFQQVTIAQVDLGFSLTLTADTIGRIFYNYEYTTQLPGNYVFEALYYNGDIELANIELKAVPGFAPDPYPHRFYAAGVEDTLFSQISGLPPYILVQLEIIFGGAVYLVTFGTTSGDNRLSLLGDFILPFNAYGQTIIHRYTNLSANPTVSYDATFDLPPFDPTITLTPPPNQPVYTNTTQGINFSVGVARMPGYPAEYTITTPQGTVINDVLSPTTSNIIYSKNVLPHEVGTYTINVTALNHNPASTTVQVAYGVDLIDYTYIAYNIIVLEVQATPNATVSFSWAGGSTTINTSSTGYGTKNFTFDPTNLNDGINTTLLTDNATGQTDDPTVIYRFLQVINKSDPLLTNAETPSKIDCAVSKGLTATLEIPELNFIESRVSNNQGFVDFVVNVPWQIAGTYNIVLTSPGYLDFLDSGFHRPDLRISDISKTQGDPQTIETFRAGRNEPITFEIEGIIPATNYNTNANGFFNVIVPATDFFTTAPANSSINANTNDSYNIVKNKTYRVTVRVPLSLQIEPTEADLPANFLFINSSYTVSGDAPSEKQISISADGDAVVFWQSLSQDNDDGYTSTLDTIESIGSVTLEINCLNQPSYSLNVTVVKAITFVGLPLAFSNTDGVVTIQVNNFPGTLTTLEIKLFNNNNSLYRVFILYDVADSNADAFFDFDTSTILFAGSITLTAYSETISGYQVTETVQANTANLGVDTDPIIPPTRSIGVMGQPFALQYNETAFNSENTNDLWWLNAWNSTVVDSLNSSNTAIFSLIENTNSESLNIAPLIPYAIDGSDSYGVFQYELISNTSFTVSFLIAQRFTTNNASSNPIYKTLLLREEGLNVSGTGLSKIISYVIGSTLYPLNVPTTWTSDVPLLATLSYINQDPANGGNTTRILYINQTKVLTLNSNVVETPPDLLQFGSSRYAGSATTNLAYLRIALYPLLDDAEIASFYDTNTNRIRRIGIQTRRNYLRNTGLALFSASSAAFGYGAKFEIIQVDDALSARSRNVSVALTDSNTTHPLINATDRPSRTGGYLNFDGSRYLELDFAYDWFNSHVCALIDKDFHNNLPECILSFTTAKNSSNFFRRREIWKLGVNSIAIVIRSSGGFLLYKYDYASVLNNQEIYITYSFSGSNNVGDFWLNDLLYATPGAENYTSNNGANPYGITHEPSSFSLFQGDSSYGHVILGATREKNHHFNGRIGYAVFPDIESNQAAGNKTAPYDDNMKRHSYIAWVMGFPRLHEELFPNSVLNENSVPYY